MKLLKLRKSIKAVSPILAVLMMIIVAVAAGLVTYAWVMGYLGFTTSKAGKAIQIQSIANSGNDLLVYVQNVGDGTVELDPDGTAVVYLNGILEPCAVDPADGILREGKTAKLTVTGAAVLPGEKVKVKVQTLGGAFMEKTTFEGEGGSGPSAYTLTLSTVGFGSVTKDLDKSTYTLGESVTLTAVPDASTFIEWGGDLAGSTTNPETIVMDSDKTVSATFERYRKQITFNGGPNGIQGEPHTDFPVFMSISNDLDIGTRSADGHEIYFTADDGTTKLDHEIEMYYEDGSGADLVAWVKIPSLSGSTTMYMYYGANTLPPQQNPTAVWNSNYKGVWHLSETGIGAVGEYKDSTSNSNNGQGGGGSAGGVPTRVAGRIGYAQDFEGNNPCDFINVGSSSSLEITGSITIEAWVRAESWDPEYWHMIVARQYGTSAGDGYLLCLDDGGTAYIVVGSASATRSGVALGQWYHIVGVASGSTKRVYINGVAGSAVGGSTWSLDSNPVLIGAGENGSPGSYPNEQFDGIIDEVRISNTVRSLEWIQTEYNNMNNPSAFYAISGQETVPP
jgi:hypothetical protein